ncbi:MAG: sugar transferase [Desulfobacterales bacterium]|nr:sugar transferase [Desulfobacterales bacterium]
MSWKIKRYFDFFASVFGIVLISPMLIFIALAIKLESKGPVLFKQKRIGRYGKEFYIYKFRSMKCDAEDKIDAIRCFNETNDIMFKMKEDPRVTKVGKIIRKLSLDELPQLINVIKGEMSLVGPRPPLQREVDKYDKWHYLRFAMLPGLTGMWQVSGRYKIKDFNKVVELDCKYLSEWNLALDFILLLKTIPIVLSTKGAA